MKLITILKGLYYSILKKMSFKSYAKKIGVNFSESTIFVGTKTSFGSEPYLISIGKHTMVSNNVTFINHDGGTFVYLENSNIIKYGKIQIGDNCFIGMNSIIMPGVKIGNNCVIGAGSIVTKSIPNNCVVAGNPAKFICSYEKYCNNLKHNNPKYNIEDYKKDKKKEVITICENISYKDDITT